MNLEEEMTPINEVANSIDKTGFTSKKAKIQPRRRRQDPVEEEDKEEEQDPVDGNLRWRSKRLCEFFSSV
jgi:hypothetical protein